MNYFKPKDLDFNLKVLPLFFIQISNSTSNPRNYFNSLAGNRIHTDYIQTRLWLGQS